MRRLILISLFFCSINFFASSSETVNDAKIFAKEMLESAQNAPDINFKDVVTDKKFDFEEAQENINSGKKPENDAFDFVSSDKVSFNISQNKNFDEDEHFITRSEDLENYTDREIIEEGIYKIEKCQKSGDAYPISLIRTLNLDAVYEPEKSSEIVKCCGHNEKKHYRSFDDASKKVKKLHEKYSKDLTIKSYTVEIDGGGMFRKYTVRWTWLHIDNTNICDNNKREHRIERPEKFEIVKEEWVFDDSANFEATKTPQCTFIDKTCLDANSIKSINGKDIFRQCWKERLSYLCLPDQKNCCSFLQKSNCQEISRKCLSESSFGCSLWELTFKCLSSVKTSQKKQKFEIIGLDESLVDHEYKPNDSFAEVSAKLSVFEQIKKELQETDSLDERSIEIFSGNREKCERSVANNLLFDCCFSFKGLANDLQLTHCNSDEVALAEKRERGLCHYVGVKEEKVLGIKSKDVHVFCCFQSKLSRIFQEEAKKQLNIDWGSPKHPNCKGLSVDSIPLIDFSKLDLSEVYEESLSKTVNIEEKLENFKKRLLDQLESENKI